jgi:type II secretory pathway predicted ATPase ExeA
MYESHFGLRERPFRSVPDDSRYYPATGHEEALARLLEGLAGEEGLLLLTGDPGLGKTLLCHCLLQRAGDLRSAFVTNSHLPNRVALLQAILYELALPHEGRSEQELRLALTDNVLTHCADHAPTLLLVDEAQHLAPDLLEELRLLANLEGGQGRALQIILVAQRRLLDTINRAELTSFRQRLAVRAALEPLPAAEAADYLLHLLRVAGGRPEQIFSGEALEVLARGSGGVPRLLNQAAHRALVLAHGAGAEQVDAEAALEALVLLGLAAEEGEDTAEDLSPADNRPRPAALSRPA